MADCKVTLKNLSVDQRGQSFVEVVLMLPLLLLALYVPIDFGFLLFTSHLTQNAVREGARIGATDDALANGSCTMPCVGATGALAETRDRMPKYLTNVTLTVSLSGVSGGTCMRMVTVTASGTYPFGFARVAGLTAPFSVSRTTELRYEPQPYGPSTKC